MFVSFSRSVRRPCGIHAAKKSEVFETIKKNGNFLSKNDKFLSKVDKYAVLIRFFSFRLPLPVMLSGAQRSRNISLMSFRRFRCALSACREILRLRFAPLRMTAGAGRKGNVPCPERARPVCGAGAAVVRQKEGTKKTQTGSGLRRGAALLPCLRRGDGEIYLKCRLRAPGIPQSARRSAPHPS